MNSPSEEKLWKTAQKRVAFRRHLIVYILVNIALIVIWYLSRDKNSPNTVMSYWFLYPLCGWGIALVIHYWNTFHDDDASITKEYNKLKKEIEEKKDEEVQ